MTQLASDAVQHGPNGGFNFFENWFFVFVLPVLLMVVAVIVLYYFRLPDLNRVRVTERLEDEIKKESAEATGIKRGQEGKHEESPSERVNSSGGNDVALNSQQTAIQMALRLLEPDERKVIDAIIAADGSLLQKEISWNTGFSRVKTHRVLARLIRRGVVTSEKYYNTNRITLSEWLKHQN